jgi:hypothetical protein
MQTGGLSNMAFAAFYFLAKRSSWKLSSKISKTKKQVLLSARLDRTTHEEHRDEEESLTLTKQPRRSLS